MKKLAFIATAFALVFSNSAHADLSAIYSSPTAYSSKPITVTVRPPSVKVKTASNKPAYTYTGTKVSVSPKYNAGPKPGKYCGWYMRTLKGGGPEYNLARNWAKRGVSAGGPAIGAIVVWPNHVGLIVGKTKTGQWLVHSGNTAGGKIATKPRSVSRAIAFRFV